MYQRAGRPGPARGGTQTTRRPVAAPPGAVLARMIGNRAMARLARAQRAPRSRTLARDLTEPRDVGKGTFKMNMKINSFPGVKCGLDGTISFKPGSTTPDTKTIKLLQAGREEDLDTGKDVVWTDDFSARMDMETVADPKKGIDPGWAIDINLAEAHKRAWKDEPDVSPYYRDYWPNRDDSQNGSKKGKTMARRRFRTTPARLGTSGSRSRPWPSRSTPEPCMEASSGASRSVIPRRASSTTSGRKGSSSRPQRPSRP